MVVAILLKKTAIGGGSKYKSLADGTYAVQAEKPGFKKIIKTVTIVNSEMNVLELQLERA